MSVSTLLVLSALPGVIVGVSLGGTALTVGQTGVVVMMVARPRHASWPRPPVSGRGLLVSPVVGAVTLWPGVGPHHGLSWHVTRGPGVPGVGQGLCLQLDIEAPGAGD